MPPLPPKHLLSATKTQAAAILAFGIIYATVVAIVVFSESEFWELFSCVGEPLLFYPFGLLAWWACLKGPQRFWRIILSGGTLIAAIALASREYILAEERGSGWNWLSLLEWLFSSQSTAWDESSWDWYFLSTGGFLTLTVPFILVAFVILGWVVPCRITRRRRPSGATASGPPDHALNDWQFGVGDMLAGTAAIAALAGLIAWVQPYPTWILDCAKNAVVFTRTYGTILLPFIPSIITVILATWSTGYILLGRTIYRCHLVILALLALANGILSRLATNAILHLVFPENDVLSAPADVTEGLGTELLYWLTLAISFILLRIAGFRVTRAPSRLLRRWSTTE